MTMSTSGKFFEKLQIAIIFIAMSALSTCAVGQTVYKCGESYSQSPCPGGRTLLIDDARDPAQKQQADEATQRAALQAKSLEKERLAREKEAMKQPPAVAKRAGKAAGKIKHTHAKSKNTPLDSFVAQVPASGKKPVRKKVSKKKTAPPA